VKRWIETWLVDFYEDNGETWPDGTPRHGPLIEALEVKRAYAPTRWANNHVVTLEHRLRRKLSYSVSGECMTTFASLPFTHARKWTQAIAAK